MDIGWALTELDSFLKLTELYKPPDPPGVVVLSARLSNRGSRSDIVASAQVVEQIFDRVLPSWRTDVPADRNRSINAWCQHIDAAERVKAALKRQEEIRERLGDNGPQMSASRLHPWIWDGARSLWQSRHYREAVAGSCKKLNAETQNKVGRVDVTETDLFKQAFSLNAPEPGKPRLRVMLNDGSKTYESIHRGLMALAEGCYATFRNPISHTEGELDEDQALEQLAALSVLARYVDSASVSR